MRSIVFIAVVALAAATATAQDLTNHEKLLLPAFSPVPLAGVNGSRFETVLRGYTEVDTSYYGVASGGGSTVGFQTQPALNPIFTPLSYGAAGASGRFLYVEASKAPDLALQYQLVSSAGRQAPLHFAALPVVRTPFTTVSRILGIQDDPILAYPNGQPAGVMLGYAHRNTLRVYDFGGNGTGQVTVERFVEGLFGRQGTLGKVVLNLDQRYGDDPTFPYFGQLDLDYCLPFSVHTPCSAFSMRVEIAPVTPGLRYWGFVSATDNSTAEVTVFAPQAQR